MELMRNSYFKFDNIEFNGKYNKNFSTLNLLPDIPSKYFTDNYKMQMRIDNDRFIEGISFEIWGDTDYWDILMVLNGMTRMDELPVNYDIVLRRAEEKLQGWKNLMALTKGGLAANKIEEKFGEFLKIEEDKNEKYRYISYISSADLATLLGEINEGFGKPKIKETLIANKSDII